MLTRSKLSDILTDMKENAVTTRVNQFIRDYRRFKEFAANGGRVKITDRQGQQFVFMRWTEKQHPPRRAERALDPKLFAGIDLDEPAVPPGGWEANR